MPTEPIRVVFCADTAYAMPAAVGIRSVLERTTGPIEIAVVDCGLDPSSIDRMQRSWTGTTGEVRFIPLAVAAADRLPLPSHGWISRVTFARLLLPSVLPRTGAG